MTAAEQKIILEQGSDYRLQLKIKADDGIHNKDMTGWKWVMAIYKASDMTLITNPPKTENFTEAFSGDDLISGQVTVHLDSTFTATIPHGNIVGQEFETNYNYYYTLTIEGTEGINTPDNLRTMRILRGQMAVRI